MPICGMAVSAVRSRVGRLYYSDEPAMKRAMMTGAAVAFALLAAGCGRPQINAPAATQPSVADAVIHVRGLSCPF